MSQELKDPLAPPQPEAAAPHAPEAEESVEAFDPAQQSLADALRVSFMILKGVMVLLLLIYLGSGTFSVDAKHKAVRLRFGQIVGQPGQQVYDEGWYIGLPYPIEQKIHVPVSPRSVNVGTAFMPSGQYRQGQGLDPISDGSLITGDANIVHGQFDVRYTIRDPAAYVRNVGSMELADELVRLFAEQGIVHAVAQMEADRFIRGADMTQARLHAQERLDAMDTGVGIETFLLRNPQPP
ncbi:MAG: SPFH domain-containing protein, partial [Phycisphaeraceae bacterium]